MFPQPQHFARASTETSVSLHPDSYIQTPQAQTKQNSTAQQMKNNKRASWYTALLVTFTAGGRTFSRIRTQKSMVPSPHSHQLHWSNSQSKLGHSYVSSCGRQGQDSPPPSCTASARGNHEGNSMDGKTTGISAFSMHSFSNPKYFITSGSKSK